MGRMNSITDYNTIKNTSTIFFGGGIFAKLTGEDGALRKCPVDIFSERASRRAGKRLRVNQAKIYKSKGFMNTNN